MIPPNVSTITRRAYNVPVTFHVLVLRSNHERLRLKHVELRRIRVDELIDIIRQEIRDEVCADWGDDLSNDSDSDDGWLNRYDSD